MVLSRLLSKWCRGIPFKKTGFTLIELLIVMLVTALLAL